mgnify:CR=1 FL=1
MKFCSHCGAQIDDNAVICIKCGCQVAQKETALQDAPSTGFAVLGFFFPLVGLILYLVWKSTSPLKAHSCGKGALIGFIVGIVSSVVYAIIVGALVGSAIGGALQILTI